MSTVAGVSAALAIAANTGCIAPDSPSSPIGARGVAGPRAPAARRMASLPSTRRTASASSSSVNGLAKYSSAPDLTASTAPCTDAYPVIIITSVSGRFSRTCRTSSIPEVRGILKSVITRSAGVASRMPSASATLAAVITR